MSQLFFGLSLYLSHCENFEYIYIYSLYVDADGKYPSHSLFYLLHYFSGQSTPFFFFFYVHTHTKINKAKKKKKE